MQISKRYIEYLIPLILILLLLLAQRSYVPAFFYTVFSMLCCIYFFPVRIFIFKKSSKKEWIADIFINFFFANFIALTVISLFAGSMPEFQQGRIIYIIINAGIFIYLFIKRKVSPDVILCALFLVLLSLSHQSQMDFFRTEAPFKELEIPY